MSLPIMKNMFAIIKMMTANGITVIADAGTPTDGTSGTGVGVAGLGSIYINTSTGLWYFNDESITSPRWNPMSNAVVGEIALLEGNVIVGNASGLGAALIAKSSGQILVGNGTTVASVGVSGDAALSSAGALTIAANAVTLAKMATLARGSLMVGGVANAVTAVDFKTSGQIAVGDGTDIKSVAVSGDITISSAGVVAIGANKVTPAMQAVTGLVQATGTIVTGDITGTSAGQLGHANGYPLVAGQGAHNVIELISVVIHYDLITAAYTGGGNVTVNNSGGGAALTGLVSNANSFAAASDKTFMFVNLAAAYQPLVENGGINLVAASAFTQPGTAAGVIRYVVNYRVHATGF